MWMGNHVHMIVVSRDAVECTRFYGEVQKQLTEAIKRLLGLKYLNLWKSNAASVVRLAGLHSMKKRIAYLYANPAQAHLVDSVENYPGFSSWDAFKEIKSEVDDSVTRSYPWIRNPSIPKLAMLGASPKYDLKLTQQLLESNKKVSHELMLSPNAWMKTCGISEDAQVQTINNDIRILLNKYEAAARNRRRKKGLKLMKAKRLVTKQLTLKYIPQKETKRIFIYAADRDTRIYMIMAYKAFCRSCAECYKKWKLGDYSIEWPPGAFIPPAPPRANWFKD